MLELQMHEAHLLRRQGMTVSQIADEIGCSERTVYYYLSESPRHRRIRKYPSKLDPYKLHIDSVLSENPEYNREKLFQDLVSYGYTGKTTILRDYAAKIARKEQLKAVIRFETVPGLQAQVDWKDAGRRTVDGERRRIYAFTMILGYSRAPFVIHTISMDQATVLTCHVLAFNYFGAVPKEILYDNMKTAFNRDAEGRWKPNRHLLRLANHYGFIPKRCRIRRPQTKGKVERFIRTYSEGFLPYLEDGLGLIEMNYRVDAWIEALLDRRLRDFGVTRRARFVEDRKSMLTLPLSDFDARREVTLRVSRESLVTYKTNRFSVPPKYIGLDLTLRVRPIGGEGTLYAGSEVLRPIPYIRDKRQTFWREEDHLALEKLWRRQLERKPSKPKILVPIPEVFVRSPSDYDKLINEGGTV